MCDYFTKDELLKLDLFNYLFKDNLHKELSFDEIFRKFRKRINRSKLYLLINEYIEYGQILINNGLLIVVGF